MILYGGLIMTTITAIAYVSILTDIPRRTLAYKAWLPFNTSIPILYWITFIYQHFCGHWGSLTSVAFDILLFGSMILICAQLNILKYRLNHIHKTLTNEAENKSEKNYLIDCIEHHKAIYELS